jgi:cytochrome b
MERLRILVWDLPVRVFHWLLAISFAGAYLTSGYDRLRYIHVTFGYTVAVLIAFRLIWAIVGTRHARLSSFSYGPQAVRTYLGSLLTRSPGLFTAGTGYARYNHLVGKWIDDVHQVAGNVMLAIVIAHIAGVLVSSVLHRENLAKAMLTGYKSGPPGEAIRTTRWVTAVLLAGFIAAFWSGAVEIPGLPRTPAVKADARNPAAMRSDRADRRQESREHGS